MEENYIERILRITQKAGQTALDHIREVSWDLKGDGSVITKADMMISAMIREGLSDLLAGDEHLLIEEEDPDVLDYLNQDVFNRHSLIWSVDPIDGTRIYSNKISHYAVSIGLLKDLKPWMGAVYFPALKELFYCDGNESFFMTDPFTPNEKKSQIVSIDQNITSQSIFLCNDALFKNYAWDYQDCHILISGCAVVDLCWPAIGRVCGSIFKSNLWDFAGAWPIFRSAGLELRTLDSGAVLDHLDESIFMKEQNSWKLKEYCIVSSANNYSVLKNKISPLPK